MSEVRNELRENPKCGVCDAVFVLRIDMSRVKAGVGGPRTFYACPNSDDGSHLRQTWEQNVTVTTRPPEGTPE